jgi:cation transport protein ChaC
LEVGGRRLTEAEQDAIARRLFDECGAEPLWVFGYGSLIWKPTFAPAAQQRATALGWHRSFCMEHAHLARHARATRPDDGARSRRPLRRHGVPDIGRGPLRRAQPDGAQGNRSPEDTDMVRWIKVQTDAGKLRALSSGPVRKTATASC